MNSSSRERALDRIRTSQLIAGNLSICAVAPAPAAP
jgi:hypothetical protein